MSYCRELKFDEKPDYNILRRKFKDLFNRRGYEYDYVFDWQKVDQKKKIKPQTARQHYKVQQQQQPPAID